MKLVMSLALLLAAGCEAHSGPIKYDPTEGEWVPLARDAYPDGYESETDACTDEILALMADVTVTVSGDFPERDGAAQPGTLTVGPHEIPVDLFNDDSASASAFPSEEYLFPDGSPFRWALFYSDHTMNITTSRPGTVRDCRTWFEQI